MEITTDLIKELRDKTGVSVMQCKKALEEVNGDIEKAIMVLQKKSAEAAVKKSDRTLGAGVIEVYVHNTGTVAAMVELLCETDFVAKNDEFKKLGRDIAMHVSALNPQFLKKEDISQNAIDMATEMLTKELEGKPEDMKAKILEGKLDAYWNDRMLLEQTFIKNPDMKIKNLIESATQKFGEKIEVSRFTRYAIGE